MNEMNLSSPEQGPLTRAEAMKRALEEHAPRAPLKLLETVKRGEREVRFKPKEKVRGVLLRESTERPKRLEGTIGKAFKAKQKIYGPNKPTDMSRVLNGTFQISPTEDRTFISVQFPDPEDQGNSLVGASPARDWIALWGPTYDENTEAERGKMAQIEPDIFRLREFKQWAGLYAFYLGEREKEIIEDSDKTQGETESDTNAHAI